MNNQNSPGLILVLIITLVLHLVEEIKKGFRHRLPFGTMTKSAFIGINIGIYTFCFITLSLSLIENELAIPFAWVFAAGILLSGLGHLSTMDVRRRYLPGGLTAFLLVVVAALLLAHLLNM